MIAMTRRGALTGLAAMGATGGAMAKTPAEPFFKGNGLPIGLQLYTLGGVLRKDVDGQLGQVAKIGYGAVELAGYIGLAPQALRAALDKAGLKATSAHVPAKGGGPEPSLENLDRLIADAKIIGFTHVVMPSFPTPERIDMKPTPGEDRPAVVTRMLSQMTVDDWKGIADLLNAKGKALKAAGLSMSYHNHNMEFSPVAGTTGLELLLQHTDPALVSFEMDVGWVVAGGQDPFAWLKKHKGRFTQMHVKDVKATTKPNFVIQQDPAEVGSGTLPWTKLLGAAYAEGVRGFFVEQEPPFDKPRLESIRISHDYLAKVVA